MRILIFFILLVIILYELSAEQAISDSLDIDPLWIHNALIFKHSNDFHSTNKTSIGVAYPVSKNYLIDFDLFQFAWINKDPFNEFERNVSVFPIFDIGIFLSTVYLIPNFDNFWILPAVYTNSSHNFFLKGNPDYTFGNEKVGFNIALFAKNNTSFYVFRKNNWFEVAPGAGVKLYYRNFAIDLGYERRYQFVENERLKSKHGFFFSITGYVSHLR
jgi:hypothetical protein